MLLGIGAVLSYTDLEFFKIETASARGRRTFFSHLKKQREQLRKIALRHQWATRKCLGLMQETSVLDLHASTIRKVLLDNGIEVPVDLVLTANDTIHVYDLISKNAQIAEMLFQMGFRDIDFDIPYGEPPLTKSPEPDYIYWLIERGADLKRRIRPVVNDQYKTSGIFSAHFVMFNLGHNMKKGHTQTMVSTIARILPISLTDHCSCQCSTDGCTPFIYMLKGYYGDASEPCGIADMDFINMSNGLPIGIIKSLYLSVARFACFESLDLTHTCCDALRIVWYGWSYVVKVPDEGVEIQQEESALLSLLDEMVDELAGRIDQITGDPAQLQACWENYWEDYVYAVLNELDKDQMTEEERHGAETIGVVWESEAEDETVCIDKPVEDTMEVKINRLFRELESIGKEI
ncbi:hypothetical protein PG985_008007 [Apiospora marii]|uniref:Post-SET domain-containing protein n=1 Tax=Apiospora marii TaxID=335849 RepID=A0ABR1R9H2_9PEZI